VKEISFSLLDEKLEEDPSIDIYSRPSGIFITFSECMNCIFEGFVIGRKKNISDDVDRKGRKMEKEELEIVEDDVIEIFSKELDIRIDGQNMRGISKKKNLNNGMNNIDEEDSHDSNMLLMMDKKILKIQNKTGKNKHCN